MNNKTGFKIKLLCCLLSALVLLACSCKRNSKKDAETTGGAFDLNASAGDDHDIYEITGDTIQGSYGMLYSYIIKSDVVEYHDIVIFRYDVKYPVFEGENKDVVSKLNEYAANEAEQFVLELKKNAEESYLNLGDDEIESFAPYSASLEVSVSTFSDEIVSLKNSKSIYDGGMHESVEETGATFGISDGAEKHIADLTDEECVFDRIINEVKVSDKAQMLFDGFEEHLRQLVKEPDSFYVTDEGLYIICPPYLIAPYSAGAFAFTIPLD